MTADELISFGSFWLSYVWIGNDARARDYITAQLNHRLRGLEFYVGRGWRDYDPVVRPARAYPKIVAELSRHAMAHAQAMIDFIQNRGQLENLPRPLQELALIVCFAEVGRGYKSALDDFEEFLTAIVQGHATWAQIKDYFSPALTYGEDFRQDWMPR